jgi:TfoX/Sxy family transcriptional regulator of competence genes
LEIQVLTHSKTLPDMLGKAANFFAEELNLTKSKYKVCIVTDPKLKAEGNNGLCAKTDDREITIALYSRLNTHKMLYTLAHEMVHVKQIAKGQYSYTRKGKTFKQYWLGKRVIASYLDRPWEIEAFQRESLLVEKLLERVEKNMKRQKRKLDK